MMPDKLVFGAFALLMWVMPVVAVYAPRCPAFFLPLAAFICLPSALQHLGRPRLKGVAVLVSWILVIGALLVMGFTHSPMQARAASIPQSVALYGLSALLLLQAMQVLAAPQRMLLWRGMVFSLLVAGVLIAIDFNFSMLINGWLSALKGREPPFPYVLDRSIILCSLLFWLVMAVYDLSGAKRLGLAIGAVVLLFVANSMSQAATVGLLVGLGVYGVAALVSPLNLRRLMGLGILAIVFFMPFLVLALNGLIGQEHNFWPEASGTVRLEIWRHATELILASPWVGYGLEAARTLPVLQGHSHPHNGALQLWLEFGVGGPFVVACLMLLLVRRMGQWPIEVARAGYAAMACWAIIFSVGYSIWQAWWMASAVILAILFTLISGLKQQPLPALSR